MKAARLMPRSVHSQGCGAITKALSVLEKARERIAPTLENERGKRLGGDAEKLQVLEVSAPLPSLRDRGSTEQNGRIKENHFPFGAISCLPLLESHHG